MNSFLQQALHFFREAYAELKKVSWLTRREAVASTIVVILLVIIIAVFVSLTDLILSRILGILL